MSVTIPERDGDGFLKDMNLWNEEIMYAMAEEDEFNLSDDVKGYIMKAREMFEETQTVPAIRVFAKELGMDRKAKALYEV